MKYGLFGFMMPVLCGKVILPYAKSTFTDLILRVVLAFVLSGTWLASTGIWCAWPIGWAVATAMSLFFLPGRRVENSGNSITISAKKERHRSFLFIFFMLPQYRKPPDSAPP